MARRITKELSELAIGGPIGGDLYKWTVTIIGPEGTPYQNGNYQIEIAFPSDYPYRPPKMRFATKIYHCSIDDKGGIDCDILKDNWSPALTISEILKEVQWCMVTGGNPWIPCDPLVPEIANIMILDPEQFVKIASEWNVKYANGDPAPNPITQTSFHKFEPFQYQRIYYRNYQKQIQKVETLKNELKKHRETRFTDNKKDDIKIFVKTLYEVRYEVKCRHDDFVWTVKMILEKQSGIPCAQQRLIFAGKQLQDYDLLVTALNLNLNTKCKLYSYPELSHIFLSIAAVAQKVNNEEKTPNVNNSYAMSPKIIHMQYVEEFDEFLKAVNLEQYLEYEERINTKRITRKTDYGRS